MSERGQQISKPDNDDLKRFRKPPNPSSKNRPMSSWAIDRLASQEIQP